jgi:hypothetical protein
MVHQSILKFMRNYEGMGGIFEEVAPPMQATKFQLEEIQKQLRKQGIDLKLWAAILEEAGVEVPNMDDALNAELAVFRSMNYESDGKPYITALDQNGKTIHIEVKNPDVYRALAGLDRIPHDIDKKLMSMFVGGVKLGAVGLSGAFALKNMARDSVIGATMRKHGGVERSPGANTAFGIAKILDNKFRSEAKRDPVMQEYYNLGAGGVTMIADYLFTGSGGVGATLRANKTRKGGAIRQYIKAAREGGDAAKVAAALDLFNAAASMVGESEQVHRVPEFYSALKEGEAKFGKGTLDAKMYAMYAAQDATANFVKAGALIRVLNKGVPFLSAAFAGTNKFWRSFTGTESTVHMKGGKKQASKAWMNAIAYITVAALLELWLHRDEEWWQEIPEDEKDRNYHFKIGDTVMKLPRPFGPGYVFGRYPQKMLLEEWKTNPDFLQDELTSLFVEMSPIRDVGGLMPYPLKPFAEATFNKNFYTGRDIVSRSIENRLPEHQYYPYTLETSKLLGKAAGVSPAKIDHVIRQMTGGMLPYTIRQVEEMVGARENKYHKADLPIVGSLFYRERPFRSASLDKMYSELDRLGDLKGSESVRRREGNKDWKLMEPKDRMKLKRLRKAASVIAELRKRHKAGRLSDDDVRRRSILVSKRALGVDKR